MRAGHDSGAAELPDVVRPWRQRVEALQERVLGQQEAAAGERAAWAQQLGEMQQQFAQAAGLLAVRAAGPRHAGLHASQSHALLQ